MLKIRGIKLTFSREKLLPSLRLIVWLTHVLIIGGFLFQMIAVNIWSLQLSPGTQKLFFIYLANPEGYLFETYAITVVGCASGILLAWRKILFGLQRSLMLLLILLAMGGCIYSFLSISGARTQSVTNSLTIDVTHYVIVRESLYFAPHFAYFVCASRDQLWSGQCFKLPYAKSGFYRLGMSLHGEGAGINDGVIHVYDFVPFQQTPLRCVTEYIELCAVE